MISYHIQNLMNAKFLLLSYPKQSLRSQYWMENTIANYPQIIIANSAMDSAVLPKDANAQLVTVWMDHKNHQKTVFTIAEDTESCFVIVAMVFVAQI